MVKVCLIMREENNFSQQYQEWFATKIIIMIINIYNIINVRAEYLPSTFYQSVVGIK